MNLNRTILQWKQVCLFYILFFNWVVHCGRPSRNSTEKIILIRIFLVEASRMNSGTIQKLIVFYFFQNMIVISYFMVFSQSAIKQFLQNQIWKLNFFEKDEMIIIFWNPKSRPRIYRICWRLEPKGIL